MILHTLARTPTDHVKAAPSKAVAALIFCPVDDLKEHATPKHLGFKVGGMLSPSRRLANPKARLISLRLPRRASSAHKLPMGETILNSWFLDRPRRNLRRVSHASLRDLHDLLGDHLCQGIIAVSYADGPQRFFISPC